jgi:large subunit ribosomal protein L50
LFLIDDVMEFYKTPVEKRAPLDALKTMKLPENLHVQTEYHRFHPGILPFSVALSGN